MTSYSQARTQGLPVAARMSPEEHAAWFAELQAEWAEQDARLDGGQWEIEARNGYIEIPVSDDTVIELHGRELVAIRGEYRGQ